MVIFQKLKKSPQTIPRLLARCRTQLYVHQLYRFFHQENLGFRPLNWLVQKKTSNCSFARYLVGKPSFQEDLLLEHTTKIISPKKSVQQICEKKISTTVVADPKLCAKFSYNSHSPPLLRVHQKNYSLTIQVFFTKTPDLRNYTLEVLSHHVSYIAL